MLPSAWVSVFKGSQQTLLITRIVFLYYRGA